ncbi:MAG TPA: hypothetical protein VJP40_09875, partial [bacterium]|nr:hypothetical protein [bacterium]
MGVAHAASFRVSPGADSDCGDNECDLASALDASENNGQNDSILVEAGDYDASAGFFYIGGDNSSLEIFGEGASETVLNGNGTNPVLSLDTTGAALDSSVDLIVTGIRFQNGTSSTGGGGLAVLSNDASLRVENCEFFDNQTDVSGGGSSSDIGGGGLAFSSLGQGSVVLVNSSFTNNSSPQSAGAGALLVANVGNIAMVGNTFVGNS